MQLGSIKVYDDAVGRVKLAAWSMIEICGACKNNLKLLMDRVYVSVGLRLVVCV